MVNVYNRRARRVQSRQRLAHALFIAAVNADHQIKLPLNVRLAHSSRALQEVQILWHGIVAGQGGVFAQLA